MGQNVKTQKNARQTHRENRWVLFNNGCIHGIQHSELVRKITSAAEVSTFAGSAGTPGSTDGVGSGALFNLPEGVAVDAVGNVYVADYRNHEIRKITSD